MAIRFAAASGLALAAALIVGQPARAQSFFSFYDVSPRQIVGMLQDDGYELRGPMLRRGDVYVCNVVSVSGRSARLIVDARDGHILERYAVRSPRWRDSDNDDGPRVLRPPRDVAGDEDRGDEPTERRQEALGDLFNPPSRVYGGESLFSSKPAPSPEAAPAPKSRHHVARRHKEPSYAKAPADAPTPDASTAAKPDKSSVAAVAPSAAAPEAKNPSVDAGKSDATPKSVPSQAPVQAKAEVDKGPAVEAKPVAVVKPDQPRKKINDLPIGTLD